MLRGRFGDQCLRSLMMLHVGHRSKRAVLTHWSKEQLHEAEGDCKTDQQADNEAGHSKGCVTGDGDQQYDKDDANGLERIHRYLPGYISALVHDFQMRIA
jgi:hypothetical protein